MQRARPYAKMKTPEVLMKRKPFLIFIVLLVVFLLLFVACSKKQNNIPVPQNLSLDDNLLTWDAVTGAISYDVRVDDNVYNAEENSFTISVSDYEEHEVCVRANTYDGTGKFPGHFQKTITIRSNAVNEVVRLTIEGMME